MLAAAAPQKKSSDGGVTEGRAFTIAFTTHHNRPITHARRTALCLGLISRFSYSSAYKSFEASLPSAAIHPAYTRHTSLP